jgi:hypothetical protein
MMKNSESTLVPEAWIKVHMNDVVEVEAFVDGQWHMLAPSEYEVMWSDELFKPVTMPYIPGNEHQAGANPLAEFLASVDDDEVDDINEELLNTGALA